MSEKRPRPLVSIVVPCYNEEEVFPLLRQALADLAKQLVEYDTEFILVDDGSRDSTWQQIRAFAAEDQRVRGVALSRNFGHQAALSCAYDLAAGDAVISMDADLQDPPEVVKEMLRHWRQGADVVYAIRSRREGESHFKLWTARLFYRLLQALAGTRIPMESGDFRLLSRRGLDALNGLREQHRFIRGLVGWIGFRTAEVYYERKARAAGTTKYHLRKMVLLAMDAIVSFSQAPLRLAYWGGFGLAAAFMGYIVYVAVMALFFDAPLVPGWTSLIFTVIAFGSVNLVCLGVIGEYVGRIYEQSKKRPLYLISERAGKGTRDAGNEPQRP
jgi:dolichol-phosphate mannosyltransferase